MNILWIVLGIIGAIVIFSIILSIASFSSEKFLQEYKKYSEIQIKENLNILDFLHNLNHKIFNGSLTIQQTKEDTLNFYAPKKNIVGLSKKTLTSNTISSFAIVAHEMGHALQDQEGKSLKLLNFLRKIGALIGFLFLPTLLIAFIFLLIGGTFFTISIVLFGTSGSILLLAIIIKILTISIEKDASKKGLSFLKEILKDQELKSCERLLKSAKLTYWGDLFRLLFSWTLLTKKSVMFRK